MTRPETQAAHAEATAHSPVIWHLWRTPDQEIWCLVTKVSMSARELDSPAPEHERMKAMRAFLLRLPAADKLCVLTGLAFFVVLILRGIFAQ